jgi:hypothetical protein
LITVSIRLILRSSIRPLAPRSTGVDSQLFRGVGTGHRCLDGIQARREAQRVGGTRGTGGRQGIQALARPRPGPRRRGVSGLRPPRRWGPCHQPLGFPVSQFDRSGHRAQLTPVGVGAFFLRPLQARRRDASASAEFPSRRYARIHVFSNPEDKANVRRVIRAVSPAMSRPYDQRWLEFERVLVCLPPALLDHGSFAAGREA